ncbi:MAG: precorrin-6y C5,15-methyltransferase (decarboxylating) subunit CbiE [Thermodesulfovibrionales bacterium]
MAKIYVVGIGFKPLDKKSRKIITHSDFILSSSRLLKVFERYEDFETVKDRINVLDNVDKTIKFIKSKIEKQKRCGLIITVLASGDPLFFGIGRRIIREIGKEIVEIAPDLSSIQLAFSRIKEPWDDAFLLSLQKGSCLKDRREKRYVIKDIPVLVKRYKKIAVLTDVENNPKSIADAIVSSSLFKKNLPVMYICERLGYADERIIKIRPDRLTAGSFSEPNVVIIVYEY